MFDVQDIRWGYEDVFARQLHSRGSAWREHPLLSGLSPPSAPISFLRCVSRAVSLQQDGKVTILDAGVVVAIDPHWREKVAESLEARSDLTFWTRSFMTFSSRSARGTSGLSRRGEGGRAELAIVPSLLTTASCLPSAPCPSSPFPFSCSSRFSQSLIL